MTRREVFDNSESEHTTNFPFRIVTSPLAARVHAAKPTLQRHYLDGSWLEWRVAQLTFICNVRFSGLIFL